jgi:glutathione peroxidase
VSSKSKIVFSVLASILAVGIITTISEKFFSDGPKKPVDGTIYDFKINSLSGKEIDFNQYKGKYLMIVNTASKCGYTPQYEDLQKLHELYGSKVAVMGFPANNFLWQEPGNNHDIEEFCQVNYGVSFQMFEKISVKGNDRHPLYAWLEAKTGKSPSWNFCKFLVSPEGEVLAYYPSKTNPLEKEIIDQITH